MDAIASLIKWFEDPSHWSGPDGIPTRLLEHIQISAESVAIGALIALPIGIVLGHYGRLGNLAINLSNVGRALPSFGILVIAFQIFGLGDLPIIISLTALAIPPMVTNSYVALREVDPDIKEAARGMGYRELAQVLRVELPLALPAIFAGIRVATVTTIGLVTITAVIGLGGFGELILEGLVSNFHTPLVVATVLSVVLALIADLTLAAAQRLSLPWARTA